MSDVFLYSRQNIADWDYHARVKKVASIIHTKQWLKWRNNGIAFEFGNSTYSAPNRSLSTFAEGITNSGRDKGIRKEFQGYWGDILVGPFNAFGVECDLKKDVHAKDLFHIVNKGTGAEQHRHHTVEVALYNMIGYMWAVEVSEISKSWAVTPYEYFAYLFFPFRLERNTQ